MLIRKALPHHMLVQAKFHSSKVYDGNMARWSGVQYNKCVTGQVPRASQPHSLHPISMQPPPQPHLVALVAELGIAVRTVHLVAPLALVDGHVA